MDIRRKIALACADIAIILIGIVLALGLRLDFDAAGMMRYTSLEHFILYCGAAMLAVIIFFLFGLYDKVWRYAGVHELQSMFYAVAITTVVCEAFVMLGWGAIFPRTCPIIAALLWLAGCGGMRFIMRIISSRRSQDSNRIVRRALVIGADDGGEVIIRELERENSGFLCVGLIDDRKENQKLHIHGVPVLGTMANLTEIIKENDIQALIMSGVKPALVRGAVQACANLPDVKLCVVPSVSDLIEGNVQVKRMRDVQIEDLLERDPVGVNEKEAEAYIKGRCVLVTGAGGSIGSEICRQVVKLGASKVILMGRGENSIYEIGIELRNAPVEQVIVDLRDKARMTQLFEKYRPQVVFHTAAHKHVPLMEANPAEAVSNNVLGTLLLVELAKKYHVEKLIAISTDKAVNPTSVMGATKRMAELILAARHIPGFAAVRFGNVLGSRGSVIPTFKRQIAAGGPVTVTHEDMTRFFMTIPEAVSLVLQAGAMARGGEIYVLDMGKPVKIIDLARNLIRLSGFEPETDIPIKVVGLRPGEKLYEELTNTGEQTEQTEIAKITRVTAPPPPEDWPGARLEELREAVRTSDDRAALKLLGELVPHFQNKQLENLP